MQRRISLLAVIIPVLFLLAVFLAYSPAAYDSLGWRLDAIKADIKYALNPPEQRIFIPQSQATPLVREITLPSDTPPPSPVIDGNAGDSTLIVETLVPTSTPPPTATPIPSAVMLDGFVHEYQMWNNCGPVNLSMALSYWGWEGNQRDTATFMKPNQRDKNVMPYEMADYVASETDLNTVVRMGGDLETIKKFVASGFPVIVEKGFEGPRFEGWMGHYQVVNGYDDAEGLFYVQDSYDGPDLEVLYDDLLDHWRAFNYLYIVIYPPDQENQVIDILGEQSDRNYNFFYAAERAREEADSLSGRDLYFALFNLGTSLRYMQDYVGSATAFDAAFANYASIPNEERPWRIVWYRTSPYFAYFYTHRYQDVIDLATTTLGVMSEPILEESYYWRAKAKLALGDQEGAIEDFEKSLEAHPDFQPSLDELRLLGIEIE